MRFDVPLDDAFLNRSQVRVLRALYRLPEGLAASGREVARRAGVSHPTALKALDLLADVGLAVVGRGSVQDTYRLNRDHVLAAPLADLFEIESAVGRELAVFVRDRIPALTDKVRSATLFGSVLWGESSTTSDVDLAVACSAADVEEVEAAMAELSEEVHRRFGNQVSALIGLHENQSDTGIWKRVEEEGLPLIRSGQPVAP
jgi:predicted nucleotidyltransferase